MHKKLLFILLIPCLSGCIFYKSCIVLMDYDKLLPTEVVYTAEDGSSRTITDSLAVYAIYDIIRYAESEPVKFVTKEKLEIKARGTTLVINRNGRALNIKGCTLLLWKQKSKRLDKLLGKSPE
ncbi:MAG TPA: hypothetical protein VEC12_09380 [Bacteroidia bacterium]|nr:hypothetical protein [Bacteroidia bacterium]